MRPQCPTAQRAARQRPVYALSTKPRNIERNPHVALSWVDPENGYHCASIQGKVVDSYTGDQAEADIDSLAEKYLGETPYPWRQPGEQRVTYVVEPTHVYHQDYE